MNIHKYSYGNFQNWGIKDYFEDCRQDINIDLCVCVSDHRQASVSIYRLDKLISGTGGINQIVQLHYEYQLGVVIIPMMILATKAKNPLEFGNEKMW